MRLWHRLLGLPGRPNSQTPYLPLPISVLALCHTTHDHHLRVEKVVMHHLGPRIPIPISLYQPYASVPEAANMRLEWPKPREGYRIRWGQTNSAQKDLH